MAPACFNMNPCWTIWYKPMSNQNPWFWSKDISWANKPGPGPLWTKFWCRTPPSGSNKESSRKPTRRFVQKNKRGENAPKACAATFYASPLPAVQPFWAIAQTQTNPGSHRCFMRACVVWHIASYPTVAVDSNGMLKLSLCLILSCCLSAVASGTVPAILAIAHAPAGT